MGSPTLGAREHSREEAKLHASHGFVSIEDDKVRVVRYAYPEEVLVGRDLYRQSQHLGEWVAATFDALYTAGPPPGLESSGGQTGSPSEDGLRT